MFHTISNNVKIYFLICKSIASFGDIVVSISIFRSKKLRMIFIIYILRYSTAKHFILRLSSQSTVYFCFRDSILIFQRVISTVGHEKVLARLGATDKILRTPRVL